MTDVLSEHCQGCDAGTSAQQVSVQMHIDELIVTGFAGACWQLDLHMRGGAHTLLALLRASLKFSSCSTKRLVSTHILMAVKHVFLVHTCTLVQVRQDLD